MRRHLGRALVALAMATSVLALAGVTVVAPAAAADADSLRWSACGAAPRECASIEVPASYDDPSGDQLTVAIARIAAGDPSQRVGSLVVNPGGPGISAIDSLEALRSSLPSSVTDTFDVVAIDPRGTGRSAPVDCGVPLDPVFDHSFTPTSAEQRASLVAALEKVAQGCETRDGARLQQISTVDTARDMDMVRARLGDDRLTYLGFSYGTYLGAVYAALFPDHVRAMVLDGAVDPTSDARAATLAQAQGFEEGLDKFLAWCGSNRDECAFADDGDPAHRFDALRASVAATPLTVGDGDDARELNDTRFDAGLLLHLYLGRAAWPTLAAALADAVRGDGERLLVAADRFLGHEPGGGDDGSVEAFWAVGCLDDPSQGVGDLQADAEAVAPRVGAFVANFSLACAVWPTRTTPATVPRLDGAAPSALVVGTTGDPATPLVGAKRLARVLGDAPLIVAQGTRHTATGSGNACVDEAVARYLRTPAKANPPRRRC